MRILAGRRIRIAQQSSIRTLALLCLTSCASLAIAQEDSDWKLVGFSPIGKDAVGVFYLQNEITRMPSGNIQVWTKALSSTKLQKAVLAVKPNDPLIQALAHKVVIGYQPPYSKVKKLSQDELLDVLSYEALANAGDIKPKVRILWEIDCRQSQYRTVSIITEKASGSPQSVWEPVPPESTIRSLKIEACPATS